jgi:sodium/potassium/calcium exchanger 6
MAALSFCLSIMWLNVAASLLVELCVVLGKIWGISPALLGATVLAWGNSMPDLVNNVSMGRDGFPVMAITACFASPMFSLLVGMGTALAVGAIEDGGELAVRVTKPLLVMYGFAAVNLVKFLVLVPLLYGYVLRRSLAFLAFGFYLTFNVVYMLVQAGVLSV